MNKYLYILGLAGAALFSACSNSDDLSIGEPSVFDKEKESVLIYEAGQNSEVPITLGACQSRGYTRAVLNPTDASGSFNTEGGKSLGVFCLATGYQYPYSDPEKENHPIENNWAADDTGLIVRMKNVAATVAGGNVTFNDHDYYYPIGKWMEYNFFAYYPWQEETVTIVIDEETTETEKRLYFTENQVLERYYHIDGSQDIIWGMTDPSDAKYSDAPNYAKPFSAGYYLWKKDHLVGDDNIANYAPQFSFEHKMVQFRFFVKAANVTVASLEKIRVRDMNITNGINHLALIVANKSNSNFNGKLYWFGNTITTEKMSIKEMGYDRKRFDKNGDGKLDSPLSITANAVNVNAVDAVGNPTDPSFAGYIMLAPPNVPKYNDRNSDNPEPNNTVYRLALKMRYYVGENNYDKDVIRLLNPPTGGFVEGMTYNIVISINSSDLGI